MLKKISKFSVRHEAYSWAKAGGLVACTTDEMVFFFMEWVRHQYAVSVDILGMTNRLSRKENNKKWRSLAMKNKNIARANMVLVEDYFHEMCRVALL